METEKCFAYFLLRPVSEGLFRVRVGHENKAIHVLFSMPAGTNAENSDPILAWLLNNIAIPKLNLMEGDYKKFSKLNIIDGSYEVSDII